MKQSLDKFEGVILDLIFLEAVGKILAAIHDLLVFFGTI